MFCGLYCSEFLYWLCENKLLIFNTHRADDKIKRLLSLYFLLDQQISFLVYFHNRRKVRNVWYLFVLWLAPRYISHWLFLHEVFNKSKFFALKCKFKRFFLNIYLKSMFRSFFMLNKSLTKAQIFNHCEDFI